MPPGSSDGVDPEEIRLDPVEADTYGTRPDRLTGRRRRLDAGRAQAQRRHVPRSSATPLPGKDGPGSGALGGNNLAVSSFFSKHQATWRDFVAYVTSLETSPYRTTTDNSP